MRFGKFNGWRQIGLVVSKDDFDGSWEVSFYIWKWFIMLGCHVAIRPSKPITRPITELGWSTRVVRSLIRRWHGTIPTLGEVAKLTDDELLATRNFGQKCLAEVRKLVPADTSAEESKK